MEGELENKSNLIEIHENTIEKLNKEEGFSNIDNNVELLVFLTKTCPHCINYDNIHMNLEKQLKNRCRIRKIYADNDKDNLFKIDNFKPIIISTYRTDTIYSSNDDKNYVDRSHTNYRNIRNIFIKESKISINNCQIFIN